MSDRVVIERVTTDRGELQLQRRGDVYEVISNGCFLMATYNGDSERALIQAAADWTPNPQKVLIGGLGVGYTLRAGFDLPSVEQVTVVEIEPVVAKWNQTHLAPFHGDALNDPRTRLVLTDLVDYVDGQPDSYDVIAIDTDNGPDWTVFDRNQALWNANGLDKLCRLLAPGGTIAFWSAHAAPAFERLLRERFSRVQARSVQAAVSDNPDVVYLVQPAQRWDG